MNERVTSGKRRPKRKPKRDRDQILLSVDDDDDDNDDVENDADNDLGVSDDVAHIDGAGGDVGEIVDVFAVGKKQPQRNHLLMLHDDADADGEDEEDVLLHNKQPALRNGKCKLSKESSESVSGTASVTTSQPTSHIVTPTRRGPATTSSATSPLKTTTRLPHEEADDICLVPEIDFEGMSTDAGSDNRESQPLLGGGGGGSHTSRISDLLGGLGRGHDHVDLVSNTFGGECSLLALLTLLTSTSHSRK